MRVYVSGWWRDPSVSAVFDLIESMGHEVALDWRCADYDQRTEGNASAMLSAARSADALVFVAHPNAHGALIELGAALAVGAPVIVYASSYGNAQASLRDSVFFRLPTVHTVTGGLDVLERVLSGVLAEDELEVLARSEGADRLGEHALLGSS